MINSEFVQNKHYMVEIKSELVLIKIDMGLVGWVLETLRGMLLD